MTGPSQADRHRMIMFILPSSLAHSWDLGKYLFGAMQCWDLGHTSQPRALDGLGGYKFGEKLGLCTCCHSVTLSPSTKPHTTALDSWSGNRVERQGPYLREVTREWSNGTAHGVGLDKGCWEQWQLGASLRWQPLSQAAGTAGNLAARRNASR